MSLLLKKLRLQLGQRVLILNPPEGYFEYLCNPLEGSKVCQEPGGEFDFVHLFVNKQSEFDELRAIATDAVRYDGILRIPYPKQNSKVPTDLGRDVPWKLIPDQVCDRWLKFQSARYGRPCDSGPPRRWQIRKGRSECFIDVY